MCCRTVRRERGYNEDHRSQDGCRSSSSRGWWEAFPAGAGRTQASKLCQTSTVLRACDRKERAPRATPLKQAAPHLAESGSSLRLDAGTPCGGGTRGLCPGSVPWGGARELAQFIRQRWFSVARITVLSCGDSLRV